MGKKIFVLIVVLMSISLIGIVAVQLYWINNTIESKNIQFRGDVKKLWQEFLNVLKLKKKSCITTRLRALSKQEDS